MPSRPLTDTEVSLIISNTSDVMHRALLILGIRTGFRISELLSLSVNDVLESSIDRSNHVVKDNITVSRSNMKGKHVSRTVVLHGQAKQALRDYVNIHKLSSNKYVNVHKLFPISRFAAHRIVKGAVQRAGLKGRISCHSMRKSFGMKVYERTGKDIVAAQRALGHKSLASTSHYLDVNKDIVDAAILSD